MVFGHTIDSSGKDGDDGGFGEEMEDSFEKALANIKDNTEARLPNAPKSLDSGEVGLNGLNVGKW